MLFFSLLSRFSKLVEHCRHPVYDTVPLPDDAIAVEDKYVGLRKRARGGNHGVLDQSLRSKKEVSYSASDSSAREPAMTMGMNTVIEV